MLVTLATQWMGLIFYLSSRPQLPAVQREFYGISLGKIGHVAEYWGLSVLLALAAQEAWARWRRAPVATGAFALTVAMLYATSDELHQAFVPGRIAAAGDVGIDAAGAVAGVATWLLLTRVWRRLSARRDRGGSWLGGRRS